MQLRSYLNLMLVLVFTVVLLGGWTRIMDAGLGCPDWPGCYGHWVLPLDAVQLEAAQSTYPDVPLETAKGWLEMVHRYAAGSLGVLILGLVILCWQQKNSRPDLFRLSCLLAVLVVIQGLFGMWTVTLRLLPQVVTLHLLGGVIILSLLIYMRQSAGQSQRIHFGRWGMLMAAVILFQVSTGGWTSANYAGWACESIFECPAGYDFNSAFDLQQVGPNYQGGVLSVQARSAILLVHKLGAIALTVFIIAYLFRLWRQGRFSPAALWVGLTLLVQLTLGVMNLIWAVPTGLAIAHHGGAIMLVAAMVWLLAEQKRRRQYEHT